MLQGIKFKAHPTARQKLVLSQWMGCARMIWNAKCEEHQYLSTFSRRYLPVGTYAPVDQSAAQFKSKEVSPWLYQCPSQILRNSATNWYRTYWKFIKGECGKPRRKRKTDKASIHLTRELYDFERCADGVVRLFIGTKRNNIGYLSVTYHGNFREPNSIYLRKQAGSYFVSFCFEDNTPAPRSDEEDFAYLRGATPEWLAENIKAVDRGVTIPVHAGDETHDFTPGQKRNKKRKQTYIKRYQKKLARQVKGSKRRTKTKFKIAKAHSKVANIRKDFCHKTSRTLVDGPEKIYIFEGLRTQDMTRRPKPKKDHKGRFISNKARQKAGLNRSILDSGWYNLEAFTYYKAKRAGKAVFKVPAPFTSQECAECGHTHPSNRPTQEKFECVSCGHIDNADRNASRVIKKRAVALILDSGTELLGKGIPLLSIGRGAVSKTGEAKADPASG